MVDRHLEPVRGRLAADPVDPHPVRPLLGEPDRVEPGGDVRVPIPGPVDLVEELGGDRAHRDEAPRARVLRDDERAVLEQLHEREADVFETRDLLEEGVVPAGRLGATLDDVSGDEGTGQPVPVVGRPPEMPGGGADHEGGVRHPAGHHDVRPGAEGGGDAPSPEVGVGGDRGDARLGRRLAGVEVGEVGAGRQVTGQPVEHVVAVDEGDRRIEPEA